METKAIEYLENEGYHIVERNFNCRHGEIDIIALKDNILSIVEVKYRKNSLRGLPEEAVTPSKIVKICKSAQYYLYSHRQYEKYQLRFDVLSILDEEIHFYENAFDFSLNGYY